MLDVSLEGKVAVVTSNVVAGLQVVVLPEVLNELVVGVVVLEVDVEVEVEVIVLLKSGADVSPLVLLCIMLVVMVL